MIGFHTSATITPLTSCSYGLQLSYCLHFQSFQQRTIILVTSMKMSWKKCARKRKPRGGLDENLMKRRKTNDEPVDRTQSTFPITHGTRVPRSINVPSQVDNPSSICVQSQASNTLSTNATFQSSGPLSTNDTSQARRPPRDSWVSDYGQALSMNRGNQTRHTGSTRRPSRAGLVARCVAAPSPIRGNWAPNRAMELSSAATIEIWETPLVIDPTTITHKEKQVNARFQCYLSLIRKFIKVLCPPFRTIILVLYLEYLFMEPLSLVSSVLVLLVRWAYLIFFIWTLRDMAAVFYLTCLMLCGRVFNLAKLFRAKLRKSFALVVVFVLSSLCVMFIVLRFCQNIWLLSMAYCSSIVVASKEPLLSLRGIILMSIDAMKHSIIQWRAIRCFVRFDRYNRNKFTSKRQPCLTSQSSSDFQWHNEETYTVA